MNTLEQSFNRWMKLLRFKASDYEHLAREKGETVTEPDIDSICNEMEAFLNGFLSDKKV